MLLTKSIAHKIHGTISAVEVLKASFQIKSGLDVIQVYFKTNMAIKCMPMSDLP